MGQLKTAKAFVLLFVATAGLAACGDDPPAGGGADDAGADATPDATPEKCEGPADCDDGLFCTGEETCVDGACVPGTPVDCDDDIACTIDVCSETQQACVSSAPDADGDGKGDEACLDDEGEPLGDDCDDNDANRFPGNIEVCDEEHHDEDCKLETYGKVDADNDGFFAARCCNLDDVGNPTCGTDCDDVRAQVSPVAGEVCDRIDNDCDDSVDEDVSVTVYPDADRDGHGAVGSTPEQRCADTVGFALVDDDCDDDDIARNPGQLEICDDVDNDCDESVDEVNNIVTWYRDFDADGFGDEAGGTLEQCEVPLGYSLVNTDCDDSAPAISPLAAELCDGIDNDCNGLPDFQIGVNDFEDDDGDGMVDLACPPLGTDCDDADAFTGGAQAEICDGRDNDCDDSVDEGANQVIWYVDQDGDGYGSLGSGSALSCQQIPGYVVAGNDCNDNNPARNPGVTELCNDTDDDCDSAIDEELAACGGIEGCEEPCDFVNANGICVPGTGCVMLSCNSGWDHCEGDDALECGTEVSSNTTSCGSCGNNCGTHVKNVITPVCNGGQCGYTGGCESGYGDCNMNPGDGCETNVWNDSNGVNCGGCNMRCDQGPFAQGTLWECVAGACQGYGCTGTYGNCDDVTDTTDSCETNMDFDPDHCGACGNDCASVLQNAQELRCEFGLCEYSRCQDGWDDCTDPLNGCETNVESDADNCGGCGIRCAPGALCTNGQCEGFAEVATGRSFTCARLETTGTTLCWGANDSGQLGDGNLGQDSEFPVLVSGPTFQKIAAGAHHACGIDQNKRVWCWGSNDLGQVGDGSGGNMGDFVDTPTPVTAPGDQVAEIALGERFTCAATAFGKAWCWGADDGQQQGNGASTTSVLTPNEIADGSSEQYGQLSAGGLFVWARTATFNLVRWGYNFSGQLQEDPGTTPSLVSETTLSGASSVTGLWAGGDHACWRRQLFSEPFLECWGAGTNFQLGNGVASNNPTPVFAVSGNIEDVTLGKSHSCVLESNGNVRCWGKNDFNQTSSPAGADQAAPVAVPLALPQNTFVEKLSKGPEASHVCVVAGGDVLCWGRNDFGQLGRGTTDPAGSPTVAPIVFP